MAHTPRVLSLSEVGEASAELVSDDCPVFHLPVLQYRSVQHCPGQRDSANGAGKRIRTKYFDHSPLGLRNLAALNRHGTQSLEHECGAVGCCGFNGRSGCALVLGCKIFADGYQCDRNGWWWRFD